MLELLYTRPTLRVRLQGDADWRLIVTPRKVSMTASSIDCALRRSMVRALDEPGYQPMLSVDNAIRHTELIFAAYYSSLYRGRVTLPLTYEGNAFLDMVAQATIGKNRSAG